jgi:hypothetical protein
MSPKNDPQNLADRYVAAWNETDAGRRRQQIAELWVSAGQHYVGEREVRGYEALESRIRESHGKNVRDGGNRFPRYRMPAGCTKSLRFIRKCFRPRSRPSSPGGISDDGRVVADYQFFPA